MEGKAGSSRRSLKYIRLAAFLAGQPSTIERIEMSIDEIEAVIGEQLPASSRFPSWWRNDDRRMHSRAWLVAGWIVLEIPGAADKIVFTRRAHA